MKIDGRQYRTIWLDPDSPEVVRAIDQRHLPFSLVIEELTTVDQVATAIKEMHVRGAGLIGAAAGFGMYLAALRARSAQAPSFDRSLAEAAVLLKSTRPTAVNLAWAVDRQLAALAAVDGAAARAERARETAQAIADEDAESCRRIGTYGLALIEGISRTKRGEPVNVLTHCNAGWLAFVDWGTATAPIYAAHERGIRVHVWVDETRPRNQGARLTAWELGEQGVPSTLIVDNTGGHLMQHGMVDLVLTGADRVTVTGDVANKIGTYLKALAARDNRVPFYVALPPSTFDWSMRDGVAEIPVEERDPAEVRSIEGWADGMVRTVLLTADKGRAANFGFDVTPSRLVTGLITDRGICSATEEGILGLYPERRQGGDA
jgi:methylthioribose-1-phosphate isomerase